ncbi:MAG: SDR family oxidoreductase [Bacteroidaceae bacterium]|jgi:NAD(P)-dependent dehydrogenase (short-subunit alcohol dehydrogenase family)|nr:SDR family oxidoreductase [Bacteroidaceae bacterium]
MNNKIAIVTGADGDMGMEETRAVAQAGYHTIMACYCPSKAQAKCEKLRKETGNENIEVIGIDLASLKSVREFADTVKERFGRVDLLMNNAGTLETGQHFTVDGLERTISVNYVGPYLLTRLLIPVMPKGARIVNMASCVHPMGRLNFPHMFERGCKGCFLRIWPYSNSKLAITLFTFELAKRIKDMGITVNAVDPGIVNTGIIRMQMFFDPITDLIFRPIIRTPLQGADTAIRLLLDKDVEGQTGTFNRSRKIIDLGKKYTQHPKMQELWDRTEEIVKPFLA